MKKEKTPKAQKLSSLRLLKPTKGATVWVFAVLAVLALLLRIPHTLGISVRLLNTQLIDRLISISADIFGITHLQVYAMSVSGLNAIDTLLFSAFIAFGAISLYATFKKTRENKRGFGTVLSILSVVAYANMILSASLLQLNIQFWYATFPNAPWILDLWCLLPVICAFLLYVLLTLISGVVASVPKKEKPAATAKESEEAPVE